MNVFGGHWERHFETIQQNWLDRVAPEDIVLIPGDISWAMQLEQAMEDLQSISALPGRKILLRGNHDYWWSSIARVRASLPEGLFALQNDALLLEDTVFCGSRGWVYATPQNPLSEQDQKILNRELLRLDMSLSEAVRLAEGRRIVVLMHFPPLLADGGDTVFTHVLAKYPVSDVVYGHLHGAGIKNGFNGLHNGIAYHLVSCDAIGFAPVIL